MGVRLHEITEPIQDNRCDQCITDGIVPMRYRARSSSPKMKTRIQEGKTLDKTYKNVMNLKDEYTGRVERLLKEATGRGPGYEEFDETCLTKIIKEDDEVMILQLRQDEDGPVWKQTQIPARRRSSLRTERTTPLLYPREESGQREDWWLRGWQTSVRGNTFFKATWSADSSRKRVHGELRARWNKCVPEDTASWSCGRSCLA